MHGGQDRGRPVPARRGQSPVLALQRRLGNRATTQLLARKTAGAHQGTFQNSVQIGKLGPLEVTQSNIGDWIAHKSSAQDLLVTTTSGKHSTELKRMADGKTKVDSLKVQTIVGENSWVIVTFTNAVLRDYAADATGATEQWKAVDFDGVHIERTSIGTPRP
ncbi:MAG TPA: hypothetical protein VMF14_00110 [Solirubrobacteraceae bacterium]|nr:hypothetical protein [Solirubrobacteraceae bacterium]